MSVSSRGGDRLVQDRILHRPQQHRHAGAIGVMPVDVVEHLLPGVDQRVQRAHALGIDGDARFCLGRRGGEDERGDQPVGIDAAVGHAAGAGIAREIVELVDIERARKGCRAGAHRPDGAAGRRDR